MSRNRRPDDPQKRELNIYTQLFAHYYFLHYSHKSGFNVLKAVLSLVSVYRNISNIFLFFVCFHVRVHAEI